MFIPVTRIAARTICPGEALFHHDQNIRRRFIPLTSSLFLIIAFMRLSC
nr:MAG TPA: hypothetical protein [Caudoviricetes sp.]